MTKPTKPSLNIPEGFATNGTKTDFEQEKIQNGFDPVDPDVLAGDNLNKFIDDTYKGLNYTIDGVTDLYKGIIVYDANEVYNLNSLVFHVEDDEKIALYKSLIENNTGNPLTDETKWQKVELGNAGGLEIGDIGIAAFGIDESKGLRRYLNGSKLSVNQNTQAFVDKLKAAVVSYPSLACSETQWQAIAANSVGGQCGKFVIQDAEEINYFAYSSTVAEVTTTYFTKSTADAESVNVYNSSFEIQGQGSISSGVLTFNTATYSRDLEADTIQQITAYVRLPKIIMPIQGLTDLTKLGELVEAGLPNITGSLAQDILSYQIGASGALSVDALGSQGAQGSSSYGRWGTWSFDASRSSDIYGNSDTVQQEQIQYPYFIQIATGVEYEVNIVNDIELNNP